ncbi:MAG: Eco57I restriction-modification methylase domain-containing protein [Kiritimatiellia bacterium]
MARTNTKADGCGELLGELFRQFSLERATAYLTRKFDSFDPSTATALPLDDSKTARDTFKSARLLGCIKSLKATRGEETNKPVLVAAVEMKRDVTERSSRQVQFNFAKKIIQDAVRGNAAGLDGYPSQGLFFFYDKDGFFRLSLVSGEMDGKRFKFNSARRQSFFIHPERPNNVARRRLCETIATFADLKAAFSVEALTKEFYAKLYAWYEWAMAPATGVTFPNDDTDDADDRRYNNEAIIRLVTRLMFTWFIRQRGIVPDELFSAEGAAKWIKSFRATSMEDGRYYRCILQNLFFATLNCQPEKRGFVPHRPGNGYSSGFFVKTKYRYEKEFTDAKGFASLLKKVPFLNCALFDCLDKQEREIDGGRLLLFDGFSDSKKRQAHIPNGLFFDPERGILPLFDTYEFTIDENNADDADVALDPELLGKVFENLLGAFNPETQETARNATGSFYTPREIVDYMVAESLKNYLKTKVGGLADAWLDDLFDASKAAQDDALPFGEEVAANIRDALYSCKILDPACGSGAFPMGILHAMVRLFRRLDPHNTDLNERIIRRYRDEKSLPPDPLESKEERFERLEAIERQLKEGQHYPDYARKLYLIENCIYGVDIQPIAAQISKLRFFISLLCDQLKNNWDADEENAGLLSLPNLEAKFVCANTLIALPKTEGELALATAGIVSLRQKLQENRHKIFGATTYSRKQALKAKDLELRDKIRETVRGTLSKPDKELIRIQRELIAKFREERKAYEEPKMVRRKKAVQGDLFGGFVQAEIGFEDVDLNKPKRDELDAKIELANRKIAAEEAKSQPANVTAIDKLANLVAGWDPYDQNASSPFFDPKWMFNIEDGFDIVIGNPPYGAKLSEADKKYCEGNYQSAKTIKGKQKGSMDTFSLFVERSVHLACLKGNCVYILPMSIVSSASMSGLHNLLFSRCGEIWVSSYAVRPQPVFENAVVNTTIMHFTRTDSCVKSIMTTKMYRKGRSFDLKQLVDRLSFVESLPFVKYGRIPKIGTKIESSILEKVLKCRKLSEFKHNRGKPIFYRSSGGRYFKVVTDYSTGSNKEKSILLQSEMVKPAGACLSANFGFWFYQIYSNNLDWKSEEIEDFPLPEMSDTERCSLAKIYDRYTKDIEKHANVRESSGKSKYTVDNFKEYKIGYSKKIIDEIDDFIGPLYGLTKEEIEFIKNYEIEFRLSDEEMVAAAGVNPPPETKKAKPRRTNRPSTVVARRDHDDEDLE